MTVFGSLRDFVIAWQMPDVIALSPGIATVLVDIVLWFGLTALAQGVMRLVAGPPPPIGWHIESGCRTA